MSYIYPTTTTRIQDYDGTFSGHVDRGSVNPGTDYAAAYGSVVVSVASGVVTDIGTSLSGSGGRVVHVNHFDGTSADYLHLSHIDVREGQGVDQGHPIGLSGASGNGSEWGYAAHLHISFRPNHYAGYGNVGNVDFDALMAAQTHPAGSGGAHPLTEQDEEDMAAKYGIGSQADNPGTLVFYGPGIQPFPIPNPIWQTVLTKYADAVNAGKEPVLTAAQWTLVAQAMEPRHIVPA